MIKVIYTLLALILLVSCTNHKSIYRAKSIRNNEVSAFEKPQGQIEITKTGEIVYYTAPIIGAAIGYYQNVIKFYPNDDRTNQVTGAVVGGLTGALSSFLYNKIRKHGVIYDINDKEMQLKWLSNFDNNLRLITGNSNIILAIPSEREFNYNIYFNCDYEYFSLAYPNSLQNKTIIDKSFNSLGVSIAPDIKKFYPNELKYIQMEHLRHCSTIEECYQFYKQNNEYYSLADAKADSLATSTEKRYTYLSYFPKGEKVTENKNKIQNDKYNNCNSIDDYVKYIEEFENDDVANLVQKAKDRIVSIMQNNLDNCRTTSDYEKFIDKYIKQKYRSSTIISDAKVKEFKQAYKECVTYKDYENYIKVYEKANYSSDLSLIKKAKENAFRLAYETCSTPEKYDWFVSEYISKDYSSDLSLIEKARLNAYQIRYDNCSTQSDFKQFVSLYDGFLRAYDPKNLILIAKKKIEKFKLEEYEQDYKNCTTASDYDNFADNYKDYDPKKLVSKAQKQSEKIRKEKELENEKHKIENEFNSLSTISDCDNFYKQYKNNNFAKTFISKLNNKKIEIQKVIDEANYRAKHQYDWIKPGACVIYTWDSFFGKQTFTAIVISIDGTRVLIEFTSEIPSGLGKKSFQHRSDLQPC